MVIEESFLKFVFNKVLNNFELIIIFVKNLVYRYGKKNFFGLKKVFEGDFVFIYIIS